MTDDTYDMAFVAPLEEINAMEESMGRPDDEQCAIIRVRRQHLQKLLEIGDRVQQIRKKTQQEGEFNLEAVPFRVDLCFFPDDFREPREIPDGQNPTPFEAAIHEAEANGLTGLLDVEVARRITQHHSIYEDISWPAIISTDIPPRFQMPESPYTTEPGPGTIKATRFDTSHILVGLLVLDMLSPQQARQRNLNNYTDFIFREMLTMLGQATNHISLPARHWTMFLERESSALCREALQVINQRADNVHLDRQQLTDLLQDQDPQVRQLASRLASRADTPSLPRGR